MLRLLLTAFALAVLALPATSQTLPAEARSYLGDWTTYSDETGEAQAVVRIFEADGAVVGRIVRVLPSEEHPEPSFICGDCEGTYAGADLRTVPLIRGMEWQGDEFAGGRILDPTSAKSYKATMKLDGPDQLRVRGYIGIRALGRTQVWRRTR